MPQPRTCDVGIGIVSSPWYLRMAASHTAGGGVFVIRYQTGCPPAAIAANYGWLNLGLGTNIKTTCSPETSQTVFILCLLSGFLLFHTSVL